jgi:hypothetical protein
MMRGTVVLGIALVAGASAALAATLDVRTGLWEVTSMGETSGMPPIPPEVLARMTPEQRAAMMAALGNTGKPDIVRSCITEKTLQRGLDFNRGESGNCKRTMLQNTSRQVDVRLECTGEQKATGTFKIQASDRQTISGRLDMVVASGANTMTIKRTLQGKWLGSDCGKVKSVEE